VLGLITCCAILLTLIVGTWRRPAVGVAAVLCLYGLKQWGQSSTLFFAEYRQVINFAVFGIALLGLVRAARRRSCVFCQMPGIGMVVLALYAYALTSILWSLDVDAALGQWQASGPYVITVALLAPLLIDDFADANVALTWTALVGATICVLALAFGDWGARGLLLYGHDVGYSADSFYEFETNPLAMSSMAGTVVVIAAAWLARRDSGVLRILAALCIAAGLAVILRTGSRGQLISTAAALVVTLPIAFRLRDARSFAALLVVGIVVAALAWWATSLVQIDVSRWDASRTTSDVAGRFENALILLRTAAANVRSLLFGLGNSSAFRVLGIYPHITGFEVLAEEGLVGAALYVAFLVLAIRSMRRIIAQPDSTGLSRSVLAVLAGLFVFEFLVSSKQGSLLISVYPFAYAIILARLERSTRQSAQAAPAARPAPSQPLPRFQNLLR
jgi:hypothetical protein